MTRRLPLIPVVDYPGPFYEKVMARVRREAHERLASVEAAVRAIVSDVARRGDAALFAYAKKFDGAGLTTATIRVSSAEIDAAARRASPDVKRAIIQASRRIEAFHLRQVSAGFSMRTAEGTLSYLIKPLRRVAMYVPGGYTVYPSSVLMSVIPAQVAGVEEIVVAHPARTGLDPNLAFALRHRKISEVYRMGGAQAIAALAHGTRSIPRVDKIVGPGNAYVAMAKKLVYGTVDIDSIAGPSEVVILADRTSNPEWVALDLLAQAEHGSGDEVAFVVTEDRAVAERIRECVAIEMDRSPVREVFTRLRSHAIMILVTPTRDDSMRLINECAPEHLQLMTATARRDLKSVRNAGAIFLGNLTPVALGDYFVGTNHVLPTGGAARFSSGLGVDDFVKRMSVAEVHARGLKAATPHVSALARAEGFVHHALSVERRGS